VPVESVQSLLAVVASANFRLPIVRAPSSVTVAFAVISTVLKSARKSVPDATMPPDQFVVVGQEPPAAFVHVPDAAELVD
jgi:hypothetical protein